MFGLVPYWYLKDTDQLAVKYSNVMVLVVLLMIYWIGVIQSFWTNVPNTYVISKVSNWMQLIINAISCSIILTRPILAKRIFKKMHQLFLKIDGKLAEFPIKMKNTRLLASIGFAILFFTIYMLYVISFDFYVTTFKYNIFTEYYWIITMFPMIIYSAGIWYAFCLFTFIYYSIKFCNEMLKQKIKARLVRIHNFNFN